MTNSKNSKDRSVDSIYQSMNPLFDNFNNDNERLLTKKEIADFLNVSVKMIDRKVSMKEIPFVKIGRLVRFSKRRVLAWAEETIPKR